MEGDSTAAADSQSAAAAAASSSSGSSGAAAAPKKRKLVSGSSDADDAGEAGEQAASSDAEGGDGDDSDSASSRKKKQKKAKRPGAQFIDDIAINEDDEEEEDEEEDDDEEEEEDNGDGEADDGEDLMDERVRRRDEAEGASDDESPAQRKARKKAEKLARKGGKAGRSRVDIGNEDDTMHMSLDQIREQNEAKALVEKFEKRYEDRGGNYDYEYDEEGANGRSSGAVLPSIRDPSLFLLKCEPGHENEVCWMLMQQFYKREADRDESQRFQIFSVFTTPASKGYIYVEADRETHVESAIKSLPIRGLVKYYRSSKQNCKVPLAEMVAALKFKTEEASVELKQWVRMKRGPYKDDLAQVVRMQDQGTLITVKLIPRIDFLYLDAKRDNDKLTRAQFKAQSSSAAARRPQQKLFDRREIERNYTPAPERKRGGVNDKNTYFWDFMGQKFKNGFYYKEMKIDALQTTHVNPLADELERFSSRTYQSDEDDDEEEKNEEKDVAVIAAEAAALSGSHRKVLFSPNDRVQVTAGGMKDVTGRVLSIKGDTLTIRPDDARLGPNFDEMAAHVRKYFTVGAHVKVVSGILKGETGMISCVFEEEDQLAIYLDSGVRAGGDPKVSAQDVIESSEVSTGRESFGSFELGDLVQLSGDMVATIIKINMSDMTVLTSLGNVLQPKLQEIRFKRQDRFARTMDKLNHTIEIGDIVQCMSGPQRGKSATVKHIVKKTLFLHNRELPDNGGLFIMQGGQVLLMMGDGSQATTGQAPKSPSHGSRSPGPAPRSPGGNNPASTAAGGAARVGPIRRDPIIGKEVKINGGMYKNYVGMCKDVQGGQARVEIRAVFRTISIARNQITEIERAAARFAEMAGRHPMYGGATPLVGGATPAHSGFGSATPGHEFGGSQTPFGAGGSRTPSHRTPSHSDSHAGDVWAPQTPAHRQEDRPAPEEDDEEEWRTGMQDAEMRTPGANPTTPGGVPQTPRTPGVNTPYEAPHDVDMDMQTPATPGAGAGAAAAAAAEPEPEPEPEEEVVAGLFTRPAFLGCFVTLAGSGSEAQYTIVGLEDGGRSVRLKAHASGGALKTVEQRDLQPVHPDKSEKDVPAMFLSSVSSKSGAYEAGDRTKVMSVYGENVLITSGSDDDADMLALAQLQQLCKCDAGQAAAAAAAAEGDEEEAPAAASKSKGKKKSKVKSEKKR